MDTLREFEESICEPCNAWNCGGNIVHENFWCYLCGGSGLKRTMLCYDTYPILYKTEAAPYLQYDRYEEEAKIDYERLKQAGHV